MGLFNWAKNQFIDIIEWLDSTNDTIVYRFPRSDNEIKHDAQLVVRESQSAVFINMGKVADVFTPGQYSLNAKNLPILSDLQGWKYGFESPFKAEVYFVNTKQFTDLKWGSKAPIMLRDKEFGPVRLRAFGTYVMKISDPATFIREISGTDGNFTTDGIINQLKDIIVSRFADTLGESKIPILDLAANYDELGDFILNKISKEFTSYGIELKKFLVENISLPQTVEEALDKRSSMGVIGNLNQYTQYQTANAMEDAAQNPGGMASGGMGMGLINKIKAYELQREGFDTIEANLKLGFDSDLREYSEAAEILTSLGVKRVKLITNNRDKINGLLELGIKVDKQVVLSSIITQNNKFYLKTKKEKCGHNIVFENI